MAPNDPVLQFVRFHANDRCMTDPSFFQAVREIAQGWEEKGLKAQYWGTSVKQTNEFSWLLLWQSHAHAIAIKADPSYPTFVQDRESLVTAPVYEAHVPFSENLQRILGAPVTQISIYKVDDGEINPNAMPVAETQELVRHAMRRKESLQAPGFIALSWGVTIEDGTRGIHLAGWRSVEDHMRLGTLDEHKVYVEEAEVTLKSFVELYISHVHFKSHSTVSST